MIECFETLYAGVSRRPRDKGGFGCRTTAFPPEALGRWAWAMHDDGGWTALIDGIRFKSVGSRLATRTGLLRGCALPMSPGCPYGDTVSERAGGISDERIAKERRLQRLRPSRPCPPPEAARSLASMRLAWTTLRVDGRPCRWAPHPNPRPGSLSPSVVNPKRGLMRASTHRDRAYASPDWTARRVKSGSCFVVAITEGLVIELCRAAKDSG